MLRPGKAQPLSSRNSCLLEEALSATGSSPLSAALQSTDYGCQQRRGLLGWLSAYTQSGWSWETRALYTTPHPDQQPGLAGIPPGLRVPVVDSPPRKPGSYLKHCTGISVLLSLNHRKPLAACRHGKAEDRPRKQVSIGRGARVNGKVSQAPGAPAGQL